MADILGVVAIIFFYILILVVGIWAGRKSKDLINQEGANELVKQQIVIIFQLKKRNYCHYIVIYKELQ
uniref:Phage protein n=1 Tax=Heterorhabditis bacteriophora TaxID=37862 RepID=A0A1I7WWP9_HETBA